MADFNAGSIEGTLDLDTDPFVNGLRLAKAQAAEFEAKSYTATLKTDYKTVGDAPDPADDATRTTTTTVKADDTQFKTTLDEDEVRLKAFGAQKAEPKVRLDTNRANAALQALERHVDGAVGAYKRAGPGGGDSGGGHGLLMLVGLAASLAPALAPAVPAVALFGAAALAAFGGAAASLALYAGVMKGAVKTLTDANAAGTTLNGTAGVAQAALKGLSSAWKDLHKAVDPGIFELLSNVFHVMAGVIPKLIPLINAISKGLIGAFQPLAHVLDGGQFEKFIALLSKNAMKDLPMLGQILSNIFRGMMGLFTALNPVIQQSLHWFVGITKEFSKWAKFKAPAFVHEVFGEVKKEGPGLLHMLGAVIGGLLSLGKGLAPLVGPATAFLTALGNGLGKIDLAPFAKGVGDVLTALAPFVDVLADLVNVLLPPLGALLSDLADSFITPLGNALGATLVPAFQDFADVISFAEPYIAKILASFADLFNPTGVGAFAAILKALKPVIEELIPPFTNLVLAIEGMVDSLLEGLTPLIGPAGDALAKFASDAAPFIDWIAKLLAHPEAAAIILGVAAGIKALSLAAKGVAAISAFSGAIGELATTVGPFLISPLGLALLAIVGLGIGFYEAYKHSAKFREAVGDVADWVQKRLWPAMKELGDYLLNTTVPALEDIAKSVYHSLLPAFKQLWATFKGSILPVLKDVGKHLEEWWPSISKIIVFVAKLYGKWVEFIAWADGHLLVWFIKFVGFVIDKLLPLFDQMLDGVGYFLKGVGWLIDAGKAVWGAAQDVAHFVSTAYDAIIALPSQIVDFFADAGTWLYTKGQHIVSGLWTGIKIAWDDVKAWFHALPGHVKDFFASAAVWLVQKGRNILEGLQSGIATVWLREKHFWSDLPDKIKDIIGDASGWLHDKGLAVLRGLYSGITDKWTNDVKPWLADVSTKVIGAIGDLGSTLSSAGGALVTGFKTGIEGMWHIVTDYIWDQLHKLPKIVQKALGIASPSKVFARLGRQTMEGFHVGLKDYYERTLVPGLAGMMGDLGDTMTPRLNLSGGAAAAQTTALHTLNDSLSMMVGSIVDALRSEGAEGRADSEATRQALINALEGHADRLVASDQATAQNLLTRLRKR